MDKWENDLKNDVYSMEEEIEAYLSTILLPAASQNQHVSQSMQSMPNMPPLEYSESSPGINVDNNLLNELNETALENQVSQVSLISLEQQNVGPSPIQSSQNTTQFNPALKTSSHCFDAWIDDLTEFNEIVFPKSSQAVSVSDVLYKLEASRDKPTIKLPKFGGNALSYGNFIDRFKIHIHDKPHLSDDMLMIQLKMHVTGDAERAISGLESKGVMYATALKILLCMRKEQLGQPSTIACCLVNRQRKQNPTK